MEEIYDVRRKKPTIYDRAKKALYGTVDVAKLFYDNLTGFLREDMGFTHNPYDSCVMNKRIEGSQCTVTFHVDDLKISHKNKNVVTHVIKT